MARQAEAVYARIATEVAARASRLWQVALSLHSRRKAVEVEAGIPGWMRP